MSKMKIAFGSLLCGVFLCGAVQAQRGAIKIESTFPGPTGDSDASYRDHPDLVVAACSHCGAHGQIMVATGQDVTIYDTHGTVLKKQTLKEFITVAGAPLGQINDPRGTYDPFIRRWILVCACAQDSLMVSAGDDATGAWKSVVMSGAAGDYTMFPGFDKNGVYVSEFQPKLNARVMALPARDVAWTAQAPFRSPMKQFLTSSHSRCGRRSTAIRRRSRTRRSFWSRVWVRRKMRQICRWSC
jgi:hypothetical protein